MYWQAQVVAFLRDCKDCGWDFQPAWDHALRKYPPRGTGFGNGRKQAVLFDFDGGEFEPSLVEFFEVACRDAWHGEKPQLAGLSEDLLDSRVTSPARHLRDRRAMYV